MAVRSTVSRKSPASLFPDTPPREPAALADWALARGGESRKHVPAELQAGHDAISDAFSLYESGADDAARDKLSAIGLSSPYLEWKLLLRGLIAYVAGDNGRALDNWGRLKPDRLPDRLCAPLRAVLDPKFRAQKSPGRQAQLREAADRLAGGVLGPLRAIQPELAQPTQLAKAMQAVKRWLPTIRRERPELEAVLERCCYSAALEGHPDGAWLFKEVFGPPACDPTLNRMQAIAAEQRADWAAANRHWQNFEASLAESADWTAEDRKRARALIWWRCGVNASKSAAEIGRPATEAKPNAESCFRRAIKLDPTLPAAYDGLYAVYVHDQPRRALEVGKERVARYPENVNAVIDLAFLARQLEELDLALDCLTRARTLNPFDARFRPLVQETLRTRARLRLQAGDLAGAAANLTEAETESDRPTVGWLAQRAILAAKMGDTSACEQLSSQARANHPEAAAFALAAEAAIAKLPKPQRKPFDDAAAAALAGPGDWGSARSLAVILAEFDGAGISYVGAKTQRTKVLKFIERCRSDGVSLAAAEQLCSALERLDEGKVLCKIANVAASAFPRDPAFPYFQARGQEIAGKAKTWRLDHLIERARSLATAMPAGDARAKTYLTLAGELENRIVRSRPVPAFLTDFLDFMDDM